MRRERLIQIVALLVALSGTVASGALIPRLIGLSDRHSLRYTNASVEGAPPIVALGTAIGALRGIIVDFLWIKIQFMKQDGLYYEVMTDAELITKLQPRFAHVWAFHGHNMAYNISVAHNTPEERWEWVKRGIDLVRNEGLRYNPNDLLLHRELAFWFSHKIEGVADDAHFHYKTELAREWHTLLGEPPYEQQARIAWIKRIADAPATLDEAERRSPGVKELVEKLRNALEGRVKFALNFRFLQAVMQYDALKGHSNYAQLLGQDKAAARSEQFLAFDANVTDEKYAEAFKTLVSHVRKRVLIDEYNMDPQLMYEYTRDFGPIDWRHGDAHALYFSLKGGQEGEDRVAVNEDDIYRIVNNDRTKLQAMQGLRRFGRISFDPMARDDLPSRLPEWRWIDVVDRYWEELSIRHFDTRGPGADLFVAFHQNFLSSSVRELYRSGEHSIARHYLDRLNSLYGIGAPDRLFNPKYDRPLPDFVWVETQAEYEYQPHLAPSEVFGALHYGLRVGIGQNRPEVYREAKAFADKVTRFFADSETNDFRTKLGTKRLGDMVRSLRDAERLVFTQLLMDTSVPLLERLVIYKRAPDEMKRAVYDQALPQVAQQFFASELSRTLSLETVFAEPPGMEDYRRLVRAREALESETGDDESIIERR